MIRKELKKKLIESLEQAKDVFDESENLSNLMSGKIKNRHFLALKMLIEVEDFNKLTDIELTMLCGVIDFAFPAGDYGFSQGQNLAMNDLLDAIFDLKHS